MTVSAVARALRDQPDAPLGAVVGHARRGLVEIAADGLRTTGGEPVTAGTIFDLASVSKVAGTTSAVHRLAHLGELDLDSAVSRFLPGSPCDRRTTIRDLLTHRAGLWEWQPFYLADDPRRAVDVLPLRYTPGTARHYSDVGFMLLGRVIEAVTGSGLAIAVQHLVHGPLGMRSTGFGPVTGVVAASSVGDRAEERMVATGEPYPIVLESRRPHRWRDEEIIGEANDGNCFHAFAGVSGHAGLFSDAADLLALGSSLAREDPHDLWGEAVSADVFRDGPDAGQALGWRSMPIALEGRRTRMLWHPGFTGCALGFVPGEDLAVVLLTNRLFAETPRPVADLWASALTAVPDLDVLPEREQLP